MPGPQKSNAVTLPIGSEAPVIFTDFATNLDLKTSGLSAQQNGQPVYVATSYSGNPLGTLQGTANNNGYKLITDLSQAVAATINAQREAFAYQRIFRKRRTRWQSLS